MSGEVITTRTTVDKLWRCPVNGGLYRKPDECVERCWVDDAKIAKHYPVTKTTTVTVTAGHLEDANAD